jgi:hypothetical protein
MAEDEKQIKSCISQLQRELKQTRKKSGDGAMSNLNGFPLKISCS